MLIWKGHGFLIAIFGILGALVLGRAAAYVHAVSHSELLSFLVVPAYAWGAALTVWLYGKTIGRPKKKMYLDTDTQRPVVLYISHSLFSISPPRWTVLTVVTACVLTVLSYGRPVVDFISKTQLMAPPSPAKAAYMEANRLIDTDKGKTGYGNTPIAERLAENFSEKVRRERELGVQKPETSSFFGLSNDKFLSYCQINPESCVFMVHVPGLRNFDKEARRFMTGMAWTQACRQAATLQPQPRLVVVGVRGVALYDEVVEGGLPDATLLKANVENEQWDRGIEHRYSEAEAQARLEKYFEPHAAGSVLPALSRDQRLAGSILALASTEAEVVLPTPMRDWKDPTGRVMRASFEGFTTASQDTGRFKRSDGKFFNVPLSRLCKEDQATLRNIAAQLAP